MWTNGDKGCLGFMLLFLCGIAVLIFLVLTTIDYHLKELIESVTRPD